MKDTFEQMTLTQLEAEIDAALKEQISQELKIGRNLKQIRDHQLYPDGDKITAFDVYLRSRFKISATYAGRIIRAYEIWHEHQSELSNHPLTTAALMELSRLKDTKRQSVIVKALVKGGDNLPLRFSVVRQEVNKELGKETAKHLKKDQPNKKEEIEKYYSNSNNFRVNVQKVISAWTESRWPEGIGVDIMRKIIINEALGMLAPTMVKAA